MWALENQTRFAAERAFVRDRDGAEIWLVAVRGTFHILPGGEVQVAEEQEPVALVPQFLGEPGSSSLRCDTDLPRTKLGTDVLLNGVAHPPGGRAESQLPVTLAVGPIRKTLIVKGPRVWGKTLFGFRPSEPQPFQALPIIYERAFGGAAPEAAAPQQLRWADENPVGCGLRIGQGEAVPNIESPEAPVKDPARGTRPAGFGAIPGPWMPRRQLAGTYDEAWQRDRQPLVPADFSDHYFYAAPEDQRVPGYLQGGEEVDLQNLSAEGLLRFRLPRVSLGFTTSIAGSSTHHRGVLHTVLIEPEHNRLVLVWHTALPCHHTLYTLRKTVVFEKERLSRTQRAETPAAAMV